MNSLHDALEYLRQYLADALDMERIDPRQGVDMAPDPTYGNNFVGVRWGAVQVVGQTGERSLSEPFMQGSIQMVTERLEAPRARLRVWIDLHDGQDEEKHLGHLSEMLKLHPPTSRVQLEEGYELAVETFDPSVQGDVFVTVATGWLYFDLTEQAEETTGPTLQSVEIQVRQNPALEPPTAETFLVE